MLEEIRRVGSYKIGARQREVEPLAPYPRINPQQERQEGYQRSGGRKRPEEDTRARRRFTAMRELIERLKQQATISRVDFNTANQELIEQGLAIAEEELLAQLLHLKTPLDSIEQLVAQMRRLSLNPNLVSGRKLTPGSTLFPVQVEDLSEYLMRFEDLQLEMGKQRPELYEEINNNGRFVLQHNRLRLRFSRSDALPAAPGVPISLTISIQVGAVEIDENGRRAIFYQRPDRSYGLYSDKSISLSI